MPKTIDPKDFPSNSSESKKPVAKAVVVAKQKPLLARIFGENLREVATYIWWDVLVPAAKSTIADMVSNGIDMIVYGDPNRGRSSRVRRERGRSYVSYNSIYENDRYPTRRAERRSERNRMSFDDVVLDTREDAEMVLTVLQEAIEQYDSCTVAEFYQAVSLPVEFTDHKWGWKNLSSAYVQRDRVGYILVLPRPIPLD